MVIALMKMLGKRSDQLLAFLEFSGNGQHGLLQYVYIAPGIQRQIGQDQFGALGQVAAVDFGKQLMDGAVGSHVTFVQV